MSTDGIRYVVNLELLKKDEALAVIKRVISETRKEAGCRFYELFQEVGQEHSNKVTMIEHWDSEEALAEHMAKTYVKEFFARSKELLAGEITLKKYKSCGI